MLRNVRILCVFLSLYRSAFAFSTVSSRRPRPTLGLRIFPVDIPATAESSFSDNLDYLTRPAFKGLNEHDLLFLAQTASSRSHVSTTSTLLFAEGEQDSPSESIGTVAGKWFFLAYVVFSLLAGLKGILDGWRPTFMKNDD